MSRISTFKNFIYYILIIVSTDSTCLGFLYGNLSKPQDCTKSILDKCNQTLTGQWPTRPFMLNVSIKKTYFEPKWNASPENLRCFKIIVKSTRTPEICRVLSYTGNETHALNFKTNISLTRYNFNIDYVFELHTLPQKSVEPVVLQEKVSVYECYSWRPEFTHAYDGKRLVVTFEKGPKKCNFKKYSVTLWNTKRKILKKIIYEKENSTKLTAIFSENICKDKYFIQIKKAWDHHNGCRDIDGTYRICSESKSDLQLYIPFVPCEKDEFLDETNLSKPENKTRHSNIIILIIIILFLTIVFLQVVYILKNLYWKRKNEGIIIFVEDFPYHINAINKLIDYLRECHLKLSLASQFLVFYEENVQLPVLAETLKSDFVLLVFSSALQKRMDAWEKQQDYIEFFREKNSNIISKSFLDILVQWDKLYICTFDHLTKGSFCSRPSYSIPRDINEMVKDLVGSSYNISIFKFFKKRLLLNKFKMAVKLAADYENANPEWFQKKYFCPKFIFKEDISYPIHQLNWS